MQKISIAFSPCPNDTFIFDALVNRRIDCEDVDWEVHLADVEELNQAAFSGRYDMTKLSYHALAHVCEDYVLLPSGSALGRGCGPLLVARESGWLGRLSEARIAVPGRYTTALFLLRAAFPEVGQLLPTLFSEIEEAVLEGRADAGLLIHENRFTYEQRGLVKLCDLGEWWEQSSGFAIPLGGIAVHRRLEPPLRAKLQRILRRSIDRAFEQPGQAMPYIRRHAQSMDDAVMLQHIGLYVNEFTRDLGSEGRAAIAHFMQLAGRPDFRAD